eukprot:COSAG01_NODE_35460_length_531_cov_1.224537_1_plen_71_part_10
MGTRDAIYTQVSKSARTCGANNRNFVPEEANLKPSSLWFILVRHPAQSDGGLLPTHQLQQREAVATHATHA